MMAAPHVVFYGQTLPLLSRIADVGEALSLSRSTAYRSAGDWPIAGPKTSQRVIVPRLLDQLGIPYSVVSDDGTVCAAVAPGEETP